MRIRESSAHRLVLEDGLKESLLGLLRRTIVVDAALQEVSIEDRMLSFQLRINRAPFSQVDVGTYGRTHWRASLAVYSDVPVWRVYLRLGNLGVSILLNESLLKEDIERQAEQIARLIGKEVIRAAPGDRRASTNV